MQVGSGPSVLQAQLQAERPQERTRVVDQQALRQAGQNGDVSGERVTRAGAQALEQGRAGVRDRRDQSSGQPVSGRSGNRGSTALVLSSSEELDAASARVGRVLQREAPVGRISAQQGSTLNTRPGQILDILV